MSDKIQVALDKIIAAVTELKTILAGDTKKSLTEAFDTLDKIKDVLSTDKWPAAVHQNLICNPDSEEDKTERARGILELMIEEDLKGLKFLDIGCGEGHCAPIAQEMGAGLSVGYDIKANDHWNLVGKDNVVLTDNYDTVTQHGPYDEILLFDVLDHVEQTDPTTLLTKAKSILKDNGKIYIRCHPWTSRHATHLYHDLNKAYLHLVFTPEELKQIVPAAKYELSNIHVTRPIATYENMIKAAGLKVVHRRDITESAEPFFKTPTIADRILKSTNFTEFPSFQLSLQFLDFVLQK
jgi:2-polyprenyl-3-methyl-5-hydroxy-6-metoxy-1,4-benzoquinol methylase